MEIFRITKVDIGWIVERLEFKYNFLGLHFCQVWKPYVKTSGMDECWGHSTKDFAIMNLIDQVKKDTYGIW
jgi:hypothetical protein